MFIARALLTRSRMGRQQTLGIHLTLTSRKEFTESLGKFFAMPPTAKPAPPQQASLTELWKRPKSTDAAKKEPDSMETEDTAEGWYN